MENKVSELDQFKTNKEKRDFIISKIENLALLITDYDGVKLDGDDKIDFLLMCLRDENVATSMIEADSNGLFNMFVILLNKTDCGETMLKAIQYKIIKDMEQSIPELSIVNRKLNPHDIN